MHRHDTEDRIMAGDTVITIIGNLTSDPELRWTPSGAAVANFTIASTPRTLDRPTQEWKDGEPPFLRCSGWRRAAGPRRRGPAAPTSPTPPPPRPPARRAREWRGGEPLFLRCSVWRQAAENVAESLTRGSRVMAQGRLTQRSRATRGGSGG